jgi:hypothetical protein
VAPELATRLKAEKKERHAEVERQAKRAADQAAREAAHAVRVAAAARRHAAEDLAHKQVQTARRARREVTAQLLQLQRLAASIQDVHNAETAAQSGQQTPPDAEQSSAHAMSTSGPARPGSTCSADDERDEPDAEITSLLTADGAPPVPAQQGDQSRAEVNAAPAPSTAIIVYSPPILTGKRQRPPTPSNSDDEASEYTKYTKPNEQSPPFVANFSPINVVDSLTDLIEAAKARDAAAKQRREQLDFESTPLAGVQSLESSTTAPLVGEGAGPSAREHEVKPKRQLSLAAFYHP